MYENQLKGVNGLHIRAKNIKQINNGFGNRFLYMTLKIQEERETEVGLS